MSSLEQEYRDLAAFVARNLPKLVLVEVPHWRSDPVHRRRTRYGAEVAVRLRRFQVSLNGKVLGHVERGLEHIYRKAGRLISRQWHRPAWSWTSEHPGVNYGQLWRQTRKSALEDMLEVLRRRGLV